MLISKNLVLIFALTFLVGMAGLRLLGPDLDYFHYLNLFNYGYSPQGETKELSFLALRYFFNKFSSAYAFQFFLVFYALLGVFLKLYAIKSYSVSFWGSLFVYVLVYFPLHEYTQIRAGVAVGILLFSLVDVVRGRFSLFLLKVLCAALFHWSALAFVPVYFFRYIRLSAFIVTALVSVFLIPFQSIILAAIEFLVSSYEPLAVYYSVHSGHTERFNVINLVFVLNLIIVGSAYWLYLKGRISERIDNFASLFFAIHLFSIFLYIVFAIIERPVPSFRLSELYSSIMIFSIPLYAKLAPDIFFMRISLYLVPVIYFLHLYFRVGIFPSL